MISSSKLRIRLLLHSKFWVKLLKTSTDSTEEGFAQSYVDFFYITSGKMPQIIEPSDSVKEEQEKNKYSRRVFGESEDELTYLKNALTSAEGFMR
jgi:hypothetical protein